MEKRLFVGNLPYSVSDEDLESAFAAHGTVTGAVVIRDRDTGRSRGFGFVEMANDDEARAAINELNGTDLQGRTITVNEARPREDRGSRGGGRY